MSTRFDFNYWPPRLIEQPPITPAQNTFNEEVCHDVLLIEDTDRRQSVHATGEWADIQDFWIESVKGPTTKDVEAHTELDPLTTEPHSGMRLLNRKYLRTSSFAFRRTAEEVARLDGEMHQTSPFYQVLSEQIDIDADDDDAAGHFLSEFVFNQRETRFLPHQLLIARRALSTMYEDVSRGDIYPWPEGIGTDAQVIIAKVALRWHENFLENSLK